MPGLSIVLVYSVISFVQTWFFYKKAKAEEVEGPLLSLYSISFGGGFLGATLGLGGGIIYNPAFLALGMKPTQAAATSMFLVLISSSAASMQYIAYN